MRNTLEIIIAVKECESVTEEELKLALVAMSSIEYFVENELTELVEAILADKPIKLKAQFAKGTLERMFFAKKKSPDEWLGPDNIPGTPEQKANLALGKKIFKNATGLDL